MRKMLLLIIVLCSAVTAGLAASCIYHNVKLNLNFDKKEPTYNYADEVEKKTLDLNKISNLFTDNVSLVGYPEFQNKIISPVSIEYYKNRKDKFPVYVIEKGEVVYFEMFPKTKSGLEFCGNDSLPTNEKGWRLARPFKVDGEKNNSLLYVRLEDLNCVVTEWLNANPAFVKSSVRKVADRGLISLNKNIRESVLLFIDNKLYSEGIFLSKDLYKSILNREFLISFFVTIILIAMNMFCKKHFWQ